VTISSDEVTAAEIAVEIVLTGKQKIVVKIFPLM
jgi:hypothetical protein